MDYGFAPLRDKLHQGDRLRILFDRRRSDTSLVHRPPKATVHEFIELVQTDTNVTRPIDNALLGSHANRFAIFINLDRTQIHQNHVDPTTFEVVAEAVRSQSVAFPASLFSASGGSIHFKGCNIGKTPVFLSKLKEAFGNPGNVTAPKYFHNLHNDLDSGIFEFMAYGFVLLEKNAFQARADLVEAFKNGPTSGPGAGNPFKLIDGAPVPDNQWETWIPRKTIRKTDMRLLRFNLGQKIGNRESFSINVELRVDTTPFGFSSDFPTNSFPTDYQQAFEQKVRSNSKFQPPFPMYERAGYSTFEEFFAGYRWTFSRAKSTTAGMSKLVVRGDRVEYNLVVPITDTSSGNLVYNFFPHPGKSFDPVVELVENDPDFFGIV